MRAHVNAVAARESTIAITLTVAVHFVMFVLSLVAVALLQDWLSTFGVDIHFWVLIVVWVLALPFFLVPSFNVFAMRVVGARPPAGSEAAYLQPLWGQVLKRASVPSDRYGLRVVADEQPTVGKDAGWHVVTVSQTAVDELSSDEMTAVLAQRLGRHAGIQSSVFSLALWIALPVVLWLGVGWLAWMVIRVLRGMARRFNAAGDAVNPRTESQAGVGLLFYLIGLVCLLAILAIFSVLVIPLVAALTGMLLLRAVDRWREYHADQFAVRLGYGQQLKAAFGGLQEFEEPRNFLQRIFSPFPAMEARLRKLP